MWPGEQVTVEKVQAKRRHFGSRGDDAVQMCHTIQELQQRLPNMSRREQRALFGKRMDKSAIEWCLIALFGMFDVHVPKDKTAGPKAPKKQAVAITHDSGAQSSSGSSKNPTPTKTPGQSSHNNSTAATGRQSSGNQSTTATSNAPDAATTSDSPPVHSPQDHSTTSTSQDAGAQSSQQTGSTTTDRTTTAPPTQDEPTPSPPQNLGVQSPEESSPDAITPIDSVQPRNNKVAVSTHDFVPRDDYVDAILQLVDAINNQDRKGVQFSLEDTPMTAWATRQPGVSFDLVRGGERTRLPVTHADEMEALDRVRKHLKDVRDKTKEQRSKQKRKDTKASVKATVAAAKTTFSVVRGKMTLPPQLPEGFYGQHLQLE